MTPTSTRLQAALAARDAAALAHLRATFAYNPPDESTGLDLWDSEFRVGEIQAEIAAAEANVSALAESVAVAERYWASMPAETAAIFGQADLAARRAKLDAAKAELETLR